MVRVNLMQLVEGRITRTKTDFLRVKKNSAGQTTFGFQLQLLGLQPAGLLFIFGVSLPVP